MINDTRHEDGSKELDLPFLPYEDRNQSSKFERPASTAPKLGVFLRTTDEKSLKNKKIIKKKL